VALCEFHYDPGHDASLAQLVANWQLPWSGISLFEHFVSQSHPKTRCTGGRRQVRMAELDKSRLELDRARRELYHNNKKHLKDMALKDDANARPPIEEDDPALRGERRLHRPPSKRR
jgi:hypothetical protein